MKLKASVSRGFRLPTYTDLYYSDPVDIPNPKLLPETAWSYEGGLLWDQGGRYKAEVTVFDRRERNDIDYVASSASPISSSNPWQAENIARLNFTGVEASFGYRLHEQNLTWLTQAYMERRARLMGCNRNIFSIIHRMMRR